MMGKLKRCLIVLFLLFPIPCSLCPSLLAQQPTSTAPLFEVNSHYLSGRTWADYKASAGAGLTLNLAAGTAYCGDPPAPVTYAGGTLALTASQTNYVYLDPAATCVPAFNITGFAVGQIPLAKVVTGASTITTVTDVRSWFVPLPCVMSATGGIQCSALGTNQDITLRPSGTGLFEVVKTDGVNQANITATTYGVDGGGILHGRYARGTESAPTGVLAGDIIAGIGGRAYHSGGAFQASSPASIHWVVSQDQTGTAYGSYLRFLTTPKNSTTRQERVVIADNGTLWAHGEATFDPKNEMQTKPISDIVVLASDSATGGSVTGVSTGVFGYGASTYTPGFRGGVASGTPESPSATLAGTKISFLGGHGFDGTIWTVGTKALILFVAAETFSASAQGTYITFETTPIGSITRAERVRISDIGNVGIGKTPGTNAQLDVAKSIVSGLNTMSFSATPTFDVSLGNTQKITLTDNVTSSTLSNASTGQTINFIICQDATGSRTFVWPTNVKGGMTIGATLSKCSAQNFIFDGTNAYALSAGVTNM
jgi:hypothetical protein